jgi:uncharacterized membrane protein YtjA (UPF0391 family)
MFWAVSLAAHFLKPGEPPMLRLAVVFLVIALISALFGFTTVAGTAYSGAKILFFVFIVLFVISLIAGRRAGGDVV